MNKDNNNRDLKLVVLDKIIHFILMGVIISVFTLYANNVITKKERIKDRKLAVSKISVFIFERKERANLLISSFDRKADIAEIRHRKQLYDNAYVRWNTHNLENKLFFHEILNNKDYQIFTRYFNKFLVTKIFRPLDTCLTRAYDAAIAKKNPLLIIDKCKSNGGTKSARIFIKQGAFCGEVMIEQFYKLSNYEKDIRKIERDKILSKIKKACSFSN